MDSNIAKASLNSLSGFMKFCKNNESKSFSISFRDINAQDIRMICNSKYASRIIELELEHLGLTELPSEIGNLLNLKGLCLSHNQLISLPPEIGNLINLETLHLRLNQLTSLPSEIGNLVNLYVLELSINLLTSLPSEIRNLGKLEWLYLLNNRLTSLPLGIGNLGKLEWLYLCDNQLTSLPIEIGNLVNLKTLALDRNQLTSLPSEVVNLGKLTSLDLNNNPIFYIPIEILINNRSINLGSNFDLGILNPKDYNEAQEKQKLTTRDAWLTFDNMEALESFLSNSNSNTEPLKIKFAFDMTQDQLSNICNLLKNNANQNLRLDFGYKNGITDISPLCSRALGSKTKSLNFGENKLRKIPRTAYNLKNIEEFKYELIDKPNAQEIAGLFYIKCLKSLSLRGFNMAELYDAF